MRARPASARSLCALDLPARGLYARSTCQRAVSMRARPARARSLCALDLVVLELHRREPPEDLHHDLQLAPLRTHVVDDPAEVDEGTLHHPDLVALLEDRLRLGLLRPQLHLA